MTGRRILLWGGLTAAAYFAVFGGEYSLLEMHRIEREQEREAARLEALRAEVRHMRARADSLHADSAAIERVARERYGMIRDGERLYRFVEGPPEDAAADTVESDADAPAPAGTAAHTSEPPPDSGPPPR